MKAYNLYYNGDKLNSFPLTKEDVLKLQTKTYAIRNTPEGKERIELKNTKIIECTII